MPYGNDAETILSECIREQPEWFNRIGMPYKRLSGRQLIKFAARLKDRLMALHPNGQRDYKGHALRSSRPGRCQDLGGFHHRYSSPTVLAVRRFEGRQAVCFETCLKFVADIFTVLKSVHPTAQAC